LLIGSRRPSRCSGRRSAGPAFCVVTQIDGVQPVRLLSNEPPGARKFESVSTHGVAKGCTIVSVGQLLIWPYVPPAVAVPARRAVAARIAVMPTILVQARVASSWLRAFRRG